jgi:hypothetical protein
MILSNKLVAAKECAMTREGERDSHVETIARRELCRETPTLLGSRVRRVFDGV